MVHASPVRTAVECVLRRQCAPLAKLLSTKAAPLASPALTVARLAAARAALNAPPATTSRHRLVLREMPAKRAALTVTRAPAQAAAFANMVSV